MVRALLYLRLTSLKNSLLSRLRRLRQPKYLFGAIAGGAYFWFFFFRHLGGPVHRAPPNPALAGMPDGFSLSLGETSPLVTALGSLALFALVAITWIIPSQKPGLGFTEAETAFLFPAPVSRRMLINFKLLSSQFTIFFTSFFFTLVSNRWSFMGGNGLTHAVGWWVILSTLNLHFTGAALVLTRLFERGDSTLRRRLTLSGGIVLVVAGTLAWMWRDLQAPAPGDVAEVGAFTHYVLTVLTGGALGWVLWPFRIVLGPFAAGDLPAFFLALGPALLLLGAHYFWVMRMQEVSFEEASIAGAQKRTAVIAQARAGQYRFGAEKPKARRSPFLLRDTGRPEIAFLWKNLLSTRSYFNLRNFAVSAAILVVGSRWIPQGTEASTAIKTVAIGLSLFTGVYLLLLGPHLARQDLRSDLANADVLKTYPLPGWQVVLGELLTPVAILTGMTWLALLAANLLFTPTGNMARSFTPVLQTTCALGVAAITPPLLALQLLVLNGATLIFPGWFQTARGQGGGIEVMGQRLIFVFGNLVVVLTALLPAAFAAGLLIFSTQWLIGGPAAVILATVVVLAVLVAEVWCGIWWLGQRFEKFDLSAELRP
jgi:ABC-2 type transport system permease protein